MSLEIRMPSRPTAAAGARPPSAAAPAPAAVEFHYAQTESFVALLRELRTSLLVSTYQANKLLVVRASRAGLSTLVRTFERPMGLAVHGGRIAMGMQDRVWFFQNAPDIAPRVEPAGHHDACFLPRSCHVTGDIGVHELAWAIPGSQPLSPEGREEKELWVVNTRFSCLCTLHPDFSFVPRWRPPFISDLAAEDRCHLNGLAVVDGRPQYVTALGETDTVDGWRANKSQGGCLIDLPSGAVIAGGLSMPHSPRWHDGRLWLLESGTGRFIVIDRDTGAEETVAELPGFTRGLAFAGPYAFIGLSRIRASSAMDGVPLAQRRGELKCGVAVVDVRSGLTVALLEFQTAVEEIFDVQLLPGLRFPEVLGFQKEAIQHTFVVPPESLTFGRGKEAPAHGNKSENLRR
jgi:uncharacterized protein (TIGR03032 family)